jgi:hypothetical protein
MLTSHNVGRFFLKARLRPLATQEQSEIIVQWAIIILTLASIALALAAADQANPWVR